MKQNRHERRALLAHSKKASTKKNFEQAVTLALRVFEDVEKVNEWMKTPLPEFGATPPMQVLLFGDSGAVKDYLRQMLTNKGKVEEAVGIDIQEVLSASAEVEKIQAAQAVSVG